MRGFNFDISSLFGNQNTGNSFGSFNFSDYASIKNGSYGKLVKSYYAEQKKSAVSDKSSSDKTKKNQFADQTIDKSGMTQMKKEADSLKTAAESLNSDDLWKKTDGKYDVDKIVGAVKTFVNEYNDTLTQASKFNSKDVAQDIRYMSSMTSTMSKMLSKAGITVGTDGKMSLNEDSLKKADMTSVKSLFTGAVSYGSQTADRAAQISKDSLMSSSIYGSNGVLSSSISNMFNNWV